MELNDLSTYKPQTGETNEGYVYGNVHYGPDTAVSLNGNTTVAEDTFVDAETDSLQYKTSQTRKRFEAKQKDENNTEVRESTIVFKTQNRNFVNEKWQAVKRSCKENNKAIKTVLKLILLLAYFVYFGFALAYHVGDEGSWRLIVCTIFGVLLILWRLFKRTRVYLIWESFLNKVSEEHSKGRRSLVLRWVLYVLMTLFMITYVILFVAIKTPENLRSLFGLAAYPFLLFLFSKHRTKVNWHTVYWSMSLQFVMALIILKTSWGAASIRWCGTRLEEFLANAEAGSIFMFGEKYTDHSFIFGALVQSAFFVVAMSVINYLGVVSFIVNTFGYALAFCLKLSPAEGINAVGNIFLHVPESAMLIQEYIADMTPSQLFLTYAGGLSTVGGTSLVIFMSSGVPAAPLIAASAMSAPAAVAASKLSFPSVDNEEVPPIPAGANGTPTTRPDFLEKPTSLMHSIIVGINQSIVLTVQAVFYITTFVIILEWINNTLIWFGNRIGVADMSAEFLLSYIFYPFAYMMGARHEDCLFLGQLFGVRTFSLAIVAYPKLGPIIVNGGKFRDYVAGGINNTWSYVGNDILLEKTNTTLIGGILDPRSEIIATYALCGSASFAIMGLIIGSFKAIVPHRIGEITQHIFRAMVVGTVASYLTACFAGLLFEEDVAYQ
ncbi:solute carrier family 28 member 3-like [Mya arenaria]|uniref:solute carrier family 28 member 3-like n=1 Tax=Mya arenaria TaxID=6604 RepID=UPI0022E2331B|nr:solute carrier family 28 member 3-like [Mya arenaria]XP_052798137.1 solute carrier family 28 member 3-like [Mya arenaria]